METNPSRARESHLVFPSTGTSHLVSACTQPAQALKLHNHVPLMHGFARIFLHDPLFPAKRHERKYSAENARGNAFSPQLFATFPANWANKINSEILVLLLKCINNESEGCWKRKGGLKVLTKAHSTLAVAKARAWKTSLSFWSMQAYSMARYIAEGKWGWEEEESCLFRGRLLSCQAVRQRERGLSHEHRAAFQAACNPGIVY